MKIDFFKERLYSAVTVRHSPPACRKRATRKRPVPEFIFPPHGKINFTERSKEHERITKAVQTENRTSAGHFP